MKVTRAPFDEAAAAAIYRVLQRAFARANARLLHNLHNEWAKRGIAKRFVPTVQIKADGAGKEGLWQWVDDVIDDALDPLPDTSMRDVADALVKAHAGAAGHTIKQIDLDDPLAISLRTNTEAVNYAAHRSAEMVGKKYDPDGNLIDNPNADWAITDTMHKVLRDEIVDAVGLHWPVDLLADHIADTGLFSDARAEMIARTETNMAQNQGPNRNTDPHHQAGGRPWSVMPENCQTRPQRCRRSRTDRHDHRCRQSRISRSRRQQRIHENVLRSERRSAAPGDDDCQSRADAGARAV